MTQISGQTTVPNAGTAVTLGSFSVSGPILIKALDTNTGVMVVGDDGTGDVTVSNGHRLLAGDMVIMQLGNLKSIYIDASVNGEGVSWLKITL